MSNKQKILIVDDNHINRKFFSMSLKKANFDTTTAENGFEAIKLAKENDFDLILMDIRMPEIDGYESSEKIRLLANHITTPILATSAESLSKDKTNYFNEFLLKPISPKILVEKIKKYFPETEENNAVFNKESALKYAYNDKDIMRKLISMFLLDLPNQMSQLDTNIHLKNKQACIDIIHKIRGSCKACGAQDLDSNLKQLSDNIKNGLSIGKVYLGSTNAVKKYNSIHLVEK